MGIKKLLKNLNEYLEKGKKKKKKNLVTCDRIDDLLEQLKEKEKKLKKQLDKEKNTSKRKRIKTELKVIALQVKKGVKRRDELCAKHD